MQACFDHELLCYVQGLLESPPPSDDPHNVILCGDDQDAVEDAKQLIDCQSGFKVQNYAVICTTMSLNSIGNTFVDISVVLDNVTMCCCMGLYCFALGLCAQLNACQLQMACVHAESVWRWLKVCQDSRSPRTRLDSRVG